MINYFTTRTKNDTCQIPRYAKINKLLHPPGADPIQIQIGAFFDIAVAFQMKRKLNVKFIVA